jgi:hypothetical protein
MRQLRHILVLLAISIALACTSQLEPAQRMLSDVTVTMAEVSADASATMPEQYAEVQRQIAALQARFDHEDYGAVIAEGPAALAATHKLGQAAAARKAQISRQLNAVWAQRAQKLPDEFSAIERRLDFLSAPANHLAAAGMDLAAARSAVREAVSLWSKAQAAYAAGNLPEAVQTADIVQSKADALAQTLLPPI